MDTHAGIDASICAAIDAGRAIVAPGAQRAAALRLAWAKRQSALGLAVWRTPEILTWEAWLTRQWREAALRQPTTTLLLAPSQERALWESVLPDALQVHATALMRAAARASQSLLALSSMAMTDEERLLAESLQRVRELCHQRRLLSLRIATPAELSFLAGSRAPLIVGQPALTALQAQLAEHYWPDEALLAPVEGAAVTPVYCRALNLEAEIRAVGAWCRKHLQQDPARRLLVVSLCQDPGPRTQSALLWRALAGNAAPDEAPELLAVEGGEPLHHQTLVHDALTALGVTGQWLETDLLMRLLASPYFQFGSAAECAALQRKLGEWGLARWRPVMLHDALRAVAAQLPAAVRLLAWLTDVAERLSHDSHRTATAWAECFSQCLQAAAFPVTGNLDSRDAQRLGRWSELLDEFAGLDAAMPPMSAAAALDALQRLARQSVHQGATGDTAITFTTQLHDPVASYDGIWVMGLAESRWPLPPRPDPYVPLQAQRRCNWPESSVALQLQAATWLQERWQQRTTELHLSYARQEGDVTHRPSPLLAPPASAWLELDVPAETPAAAAMPAMDADLPAMDVSTANASLRGGVERLRQQQECAFRAQALWRLQAMQPATLTDGVPARLRGMLLHKLLEGLWGELRDQQRLLQLTPEEQSQRVTAHWLAALRAHAADGAAWIDPAVIELETHRALRVAERVLQLERQRAPFSVVQREFQTRLALQDKTLSMRIDRIDRTPDGAHLLIDYKSGQAETIQLHEGLPRPLQLAAYAVALTQSGIAIDGALLLCLKPAQLGYSGAATEEVSLPGRIRPVADWPQALDQWQLQLQQLLSDHLAGSARLAASPKACRHCHLPAFCRRNTESESEAEGDDE